MLTDRDLFRRGQAAPVPAGPLPYPAARVEQVRAMLRRDLGSDPSDTELARWCKWLSASGAWDAEK